jgi:hypothetical protein
MARLAAPSEWYTSSVSRLAAILGLTLCGACTQLVATVGVEQGDEPVDAGSDAADRDATTAPEASAANDGAAQDASEPAEAASLNGQDDAATPCLYFPDVIGPFHESGVTSVDSGVITASLDQALSCPSPQANAVSYRRNDGRPLVEAHHAYVWVWPTGGGGSLSAYAADNACEQPLLPFGYWIFVKDFPPSCGMITFGQPFDVLRLTNVQAPTPFPHGFSLCEPPCP